MAIRILNNRGEKLEDLIKRTMSNARASASTAVANRNNGTTLSANVLTTSSLNSILKRAASVPTTAASSTAKAPSLLRQLSDAANRARDNAVQLAEPKLNTPNVPVPQSNPKPILTPAPMPTAQKPTQNNISISNPDSGNSVSLSQLNKLGIGVKPLNQSIDDLNAKYGNSEWDYSDPEVIRVQKAAGEANAAAKKADAESHKPTFVDYLNPFGENGLFGAKQQENVKEVTAPITDALDDVSTGIWQGREGKEWEPMDIARFVADLPVGMAKAIPEGAIKISQGVSGVRTKDDGTKEYLTGDQRVADLVDGYLSTGGLAMGASGKLLSSLGIKVAGEAAEQVGKQGARQIIGSILKDSLKEGAEEVVQAVASDWSDNRNIDMTPVELAKAGLGGVAGGLVMGGSAIGVNSVRNSVAKAMGVDYTQAPTETKQKIDNAAGEIYNSNRNLFTVANEFLNRHPVGMIVKDVNSGSVDSRNNSASLGHAQQTMNPQDITTGTPFEGPVFRGSGDGRKLNAQFGQNIVSDGKYYAFTPEYAAEYGDTIDPYVIKSNNPLVIRSDDEWRKFARDSGAKYPNPTGLNKEQSKQISDLFRDHIKKLGYDSLVIDTSRSKNVDKKLIKDVFDGDQIISFNPAAEQQQSSTQSDPAINVGERVEAPVKKTKSPPQQIERKTVSSRPSQDGVSLSPSPLSAETRTATQSALGIESRPTELTSPQTRRTSKISVEKPQSEMLLERSYSNNNAKPEYRKVKEKLLDFRRRALDKYSALVDLELQSNVARGIKRNKSYIDPTLTNAVDRVVKSGTIAKQYADDNGLTEIIKEARGKNPLHETQKIKAFDQYLEARRVIELSDVKGKDYNTSIRVRDAQLLVDNAPSDFVDLAKKVYKYNDKLLSDSVKNGLISSELSTQLRKQYKNYVPLHRVFSGDEVMLPGGRIVGNIGSLSSQNVVKKLSYKGSSREVLSPLAEIARNTESTIKEFEVNKTAKEIINRLDDFTNGARLLKKNEKVGNRPSISVMKGGKKVTYLVPKEIAEEAKNLTAPSQNVLMNILSVPTKGLRAGATTLNSAFTLRNVVKDTIQSLVSSKSAYSYVKNIPKAVKEVFSPNSTVRGEVARQGIIGDPFERYMTVKSDKPIINIKSTKNPIKHIENIFGRFEEINRFANYLGALEYAKKSGLKNPEAFASVQARRVSTDFSRSGSVIGEANRIIPFLNAGVQGSRQLMRSFYENPAKMTVSLAGVAGVMAAVSVYNNSDDRKKVWDDISDYEKETNLIMVLPGAKKNSNGDYDGIIKIPMPQMLYAMTRAINSGKVDENTLKDIVSTVTSVDLNNPASTYTPQILKPIIENALNVDMFTGANIVPNSQKNLSPAEQIGKSGAAMQAIGKAMNMSPAQLQQVFNAYTGSLGKYVTTGQLDKLIPGKSFTEAAEMSSYQKAAKQYDSLSDKLMSDPSFSNLDSATRNTRLGYLMSDLYAVEDAKMSGDKEALSKLSEKQQDLMDSGFNVEMYNFAKDDSYIGRVTSKNSIYKIVESEGISKIRRTDKKSASYTGDISGLRKQQQDLLAQTTSELEINQETDNWDKQANYYDAKSAALQNKLKETELGYKNGENSKQDIQDVQDEIATAEKEATISKVNNTVKNYTDAKQLLDGANLTSVYDLARLYDETSVTAWRKLASSDPGLYKALLAYDNARVKQQVSDKSGDSSKNKYYYTGGGRGSGGRSASATSLLGSETARNAAYTSGMGTSSSAKPKGLKVGSAPVLGNSKTRTIYANGVGSSGNRLHFTPEQIAIATKKLSMG